MTGEADELCQSARNAVGTLRRRRDQRKIAADPARWALSRRISSICASVATYRSGTFRRRFQNLLAGVTQ